MGRSSGYRDTGIKLVLWGQPGAFKSTFASRLSSPLFIDTNSGSGRLNVEREDVDCWDSTQAVLDGIESGKEECKTVVFEEWGASESHLLSWHLKKVGKPSLYYGHGQGFMQFRSRVADVLRQLDRISYRGTNVVVIAHSIEKTFSNPEGPDYDKYIPVCDKGAWAQLYRFADAVLYFGRKVYASEDKSGKTIGVTGDNKIFCQHTALFDAKNRFNMPKSLPNDYLSTQRLLWFIEGTKLLATNELNQLIEKDSNYKPDMTDDRKVQLYVFLKEKDNG